MRAVLNAIDDCTVLPGAGAFELACHKSLTDFAHSAEVTGKVKLGVLAFAEAMLVIPKTLAENSGFDMSVRSHASFVRFGVISVFISSSEQVAPIIRKHLCFWCRIH
jgi:chaperonin GroEL (HSP60 family)